MWQKTVRRLEALYVGEVIKSSRDKRYVDFAVPNSAKLIIPLADGMGSQASQASTKIQVDCIFKTA